ncbi:LTA synthase family protein [Lapidilactobacillus salsurivasis]
MQSKKISRAIWTSLILVGLTVFYFIGFGPSGVYVYHLNQTTITLGWLAGTTLKYALTIGWIWALLWVLTTGPSLYLRDSLRGWWLLWAGGLLLLFGAVASQVSFTWTNLYDQLFLISRNQFPFITGLLLYSLVQPYFRKIAGSLQVTWILGAVLCLPVVAGRDLWGFGTILTSWTAILVLGLLSEVLRQRPRLFTKLWWWLGGVGVAYLLVLVAAWINPTRGFDPNLVTKRWLAPLSPLTLITALVLAQVLQQWFRLRPAVAAQPGAAGFGARLWHRTGKLAVLIAMLGLGSSAYAKFSWQLFTGMRDWLSPLFHALWVPVAALIITLALLLGCFVLAWLLQRHQLWQWSETHGLVDLASGLTALTHHYRQWLPQLWHKLQRPVLAGVILYVVQTGSTLAMNRSWRTVENIVRPNDSVLAKTLISNFPQMVMGTVLLLAVYWVLLSLTNRYWLSLLTVASCDILFTIANVLKIKSRNEPIIPADLAELKSFSSLIEMIGQGTFIAIILVIVGLIGVMILIEHRSTSAHQNWRVRVVKLVVAGSFLFSLTQLHHPNSLGLALVQTMGGDTQSMNLLMHAQNNGPLLTYLNQMDIKVMTTPKDYSQATIKALIKKYQQRAAALNQTRTNNVSDQTFLFNLSESFSDPRRITGLKLNRDPIPTIERLKQTATGGQMMSFGYGGGTADMEYMSLTGISMGNFDATMRTPFTQLVTGLPSAPSIGDYFGYASALHPYQGGFYNRKAVYQKFGFNKFAFLGSQYQIYDQKKIGTSPYLSDETAYDNALRQIKAQQNGQFINLISIQNHMPFTPDYYPDHDYVVSGTGFTKANKTAIEHYTQGLAYTDAAVKKFQKQLDQLAKPVIWVFYGDHLAGLYNSSNQVQMHATDYFVYANKYAREHGAVSKLTKHTNYVGTNDFIALAFEQANAKVDPIIALLTDVQQQLPAQWEKTANSDTSAVYGTQFVDQMGNLLGYPELTKKQREIFHDYQLLQYDITAGKQYSLKLVKSAKN